AAQRARALRPALPQTALAFGDIFTIVPPIDNERSLEEYQRGLRTAPDQTDLLGAAALPEFAWGRWNSARVRLTRAAALDPRSANTARRLGLAHIFLRQWAAADSAA